MFQIKQMTREIKSRPIGPLITKNWERKKAIGRTKVLYSLRNREKNIQNATPRKTLPPMREFEEFSVLPLCS